MRWTEQGIIRSLLIFWHSFGDIIWHGSEYNERGEKQLAEYLDYFHKELKVPLDRGYMLSFNFNQKKEIGVKQIQVCGKAIVEFFIQL